MIILDTHVLIWWVNDNEEISKAARKAINTAKENNAIVISSISIWEIFLLIKKGRLKLTMDTDTWIKKITSLSYIQSISVDNNIAAKSIILPGEFHDDPADRMIVATAREKGIPLVTKDERIRSYSHVQTIW